MTTIKIECPECKGTGLYRGMCEKNGAAVVCRSCKGKGYIFYSYNEFTGRKKRDDVKRVFKKNCGHVCSANNVTTKEGKTYYFEDYGCTYEEWLNGATPKPMEELCCPYNYYNQGTENEPLIDCAVYAKKCNISDCEMYEHKNICWQKFHARISINPNFDFEREGLQDE